MFGLRFSKNHAGGAHTQRRRRVSAVARTQARPHTLARLPAQPNGLPSYCEGAQAKGWGPACRAAQQATTRRAVLVPQQAADSLQRRMEGAARVSACLRQICHARGRVPGPTLVTQQGQPPARTALCHSWTRLQQRTALAAHLSLTLISVETVDGSMGRWVDGWTPTLPSQLPARDRILKSVCLWHATSATTPP